MSTTTKEPLTSVYCEESGGWAILESVQQRQIATFLTEQDAGDYLAHFEIIPQLIAERDRLTAERDQLKAALEGLVECEAVQEAYKLPGYKDEFCQCQYCVAVRLLDNLKDQP